MPAHYASIFDIGLVNRQHYPLVMDKAMQNGDSMKPYNFAASDSTVLYIYYILYMGKAWV